MESTIRTFDRGFSVAGISIFAKEKRSSKLWLTYQMYCIILVTMAIVFSCNFVVATLPDIRGSLEAMTMVTTFGVLIFCISLFLFKKATFENFVDEIVFKDLALEHAFVKFVIKTSTIKSAKVEVLKEMIPRTREDLFKRTGLLLRIYLSTCFVTCFIYVFGAVYQDIASDDESPRFFPFQMKYPWSVDGTAVYIATFLFESHIGCLLSMGSPCLLSIMILFILQVKRQLQILTFITIHLAEMGSELTARQGDWQTGCSWILAQNLEHYLKNKRFVKRLNRACKSLLFGIVVFSMTMEGVCLVRLFIASDPLELITAIAHTATLMFGIFFFTFQGQIINDACEDLEGALMEKWYLHDLKHRKSVLIFHQAVSHKIPLQLFGSVNLSLETFTWVVKTGMSCFTLMTSVLEK